MSKNHTYSNFKKRLVDILEAQGLGELKVEQIRMWLNGDKTQLMTTFKEIAESSEKMQQDSGAEETKGGKSTYK